MPEEKFEIRRSANDQYYFVLTAPNNEIIAKSEMYTTKDSCKHGIESVRKYSLTAHTEDKTT